MESLGYTILYLLNPPTSMVPWAFLDFNNMQLVLEKKNEFLDIKEKNEVFQVDPKIPERFVKPGPQDPNDQDLEPENPMIDKSKFDLNGVFDPRVPSDIRVIHAFLRVASQTKYFHRPNYELLKEIIRQDRPVNELEQKI